jgi:hypothetical protein
MCALVCDLTADEMRNDALDYQDTSKTDRTQLKLDVLYTPYPKLSDDLRSTRVIASKNT